MLVATAFIDDGRQLLILGLSREDLQQLVNGEPMDITRETHGPAVPENLAVSILAGETEAAIVEYLSHHTGSVTVVITQEKES